MIATKQELVQLQAEFVQLVESWNALSRAAQAKQWASYTESLDQGDSGYHPFGRVLINAWCDGWSAIGGMVLGADGQLGPALRVAA